MTLSSNAINSALAMETDEVWLVLLEFSHSSISEPLRFVNNNVDITSNGNVYTAFPFEITLPNEDAESQGEASLRIDNIDRQIVEFVRSIQGVPDCSISVILADTPDVVEFGPLEMQLTNVEYDSIVVEGTITYENILSQAFPGTKFIPSLFPGMF